MKKIYLLPVVFLLVSSLKSMTPEKAVKAVEGMQELIAKIDAALVKVTPNIEAAVADSKKLNEINAALGIVYEEISQISVKLAVFSDIRKAKAAAGLEKKKFSEFTAAEKGAFFDKFNAEMITPLIAEITASKLKRQITDYK